MPRAIHNPNFEQQGTSIVPKTKKNIWAEVWLASGLVAKKDPWYKANKVTKGQAYFVWEGIRYNAECAQILIIGDAIRSKCKATQEMESKFKLQREIGRTKMEGFFLFFYFGED